MRHGQGTGGSTGDRGQWGRSKRAREGGRIGMYDIRIYKWSEPQQLIGFVVGDGSNNSWGRGNAFP
jgi:hypothetical protein